MEEIDTKTLWSIDAFKETFSHQTHYQKALIVLTKNMAVKRYQFLRIVLNLLNELKIATLIYDEFDSEITTQDLIKGAEVARDFECDLIIGIGGAKTLDAAKLIAALTKNPVNHIDFTALEKIEECLDIIAVPTTIHVKSAFSETALFVDGMRETIHSVKHKGFKPKFSLILPEVIESLPNDVLILHTLEALYTASEIFILTGEHQERVREIIETIHQTLQEENLKENIVRLLESSVNLSQIHHMITPLEAFERAFLLLHPEIPYGAAQSLCIMSYYHKLNHYSAYNQRIAELADMVNVDAKGYDYPEQAQAFLDYFKTFLNTLQMRSLDLKSYGVDSASISDYVHYTKTILNDQCPFSDDELYDMFEESLTL